MYRNSRYIVTAMLMLVFGAAATQAMDSLTLEEAMNRAFENNPEVVAAQAEIEAMEKMADQEGATPNPEFEIEVGELGASGGTDALEMTFSITQDVELAGKSRKRREAALLEAEVARNVRHSTVLNLQAEVAEAFVEAQAALSKANLQKEMAAIATEALQTVAERVKAGKVSPIEETQARVEMTANRIELRRSLAQWSAARSALAATWGGSGDEIVDVESMANEFTPPPSFESLVARLAKSPDLLRLDAEIAVARAVVELEQANSVPDIGVTGGVSTVGSGGETTFLVAVSVPFPVFDRNQGAVAAAEAGVTRSRAKKQVAVRGLRSKLAITFKELEATREEVETLRDLLLPGAGEAYEAIREGYQYGKFEYLVLLEAQRTLLEARTQFVEASAAYHLARVKLERLSGSFVKSNSTN